MDQIIWSSGLNQNIIYLILLLQRLPEVALVSIVDCRGNATPHSRAEWCGIVSMTQQVAATELDIIIELGSRAEDGCMHSFRDRGGRVVS